MKLNEGRTPTSLPNVFFVKGDLLTHPCDLIIHQCNCLTTTPHGLAADIFKLYPETNLYSKRRSLDHKNLAIEEDRGVVGKTVIVGMVAAIMGQWRPGKCGSRYRHSYPEHPDVETPQRRVMWFQQGLSDLEKQLKQMPEVKIVAFPYRIGCGLAGGDWEMYLAMIADFARLNPQLTIDILVKSI